jgi:hypothetical protein
MFSNNGGLKGNSCSSHDQDKNFSVAYSLQAKSLAAQVKRRLGKNALEI